MCLFGGQLVSLLRAVAEALLSNLSLLGLYLRGVLASLKAK